MLECYHLKVSKDDMYCKCLMEMLNVKNRREISNTDVQKRECLVWIECHERLKHLYP
jgi:hypothetical protein